MRRAPVLLALLVLLAGCGSSGDAATQAQPTGPCAAGQDVPPGAQAQRLQADLDGDGRADEVVSWVRDGERVVQARLADGQAAAPAALFAGDLLAAPDLDGDGRAEVLAGTGTGRGTGFFLEGCRLLPLDLAVTDRRWEFATGPGAALACGPGGAVEEAVTDGPETVRRAWTVSKGVVTGGRPTGTGPVTDAGIDCT